MKWHKVTDVVETGQPFLKKVKAGGKSVCLIGYEDKVFALSAKCPHAGGDLSKGWCRDGLLICPLHRYSYHLDTGKGSTGQNDYVESYAVEIRDDGVYIGLLTFFEKLFSAFK